MIGCAGILHSMISNMNQRDHDNFYLVTSRVPSWDLCMDSDTFLCSFGSCRFGWATFWDSLDRI